MIAKRHYIIKTELGYVGDITYNLSNGEVERFNFTGDKEDAYIFTRDDIIELHNPEIGMQIQRELTISLISYQIVKANEEQLLRKIEVFIECVSDNVYETDRIIDRSKRNVMMFDGDRAFEDFECIERQMKKLENIIEIFENEVKK